MELLHHSVCRREYYCLYDLLLPLNFRLCFFSTCDLEDSLRFCFDFLLLFISCFRIITYFHNYQQFGQLEPLSFLGLPWAFSICFTILSWAENSIPQNLQIVPEITISFFLLKKFMILNDKLFTIKCYDNNETPTNLKKTSIHPTFFLFIYDHILYRKIKMNIEKRVIAHINR